VSENSEKRIHRRRVRKWWQEIDASLPDGITPLEAVVSIKCIDDQGEVCLYSKKTSGITVWEAWGMLGYSMDDYSSATTQAAIEDDE